MSKKKFYTVWQGRAPGVYTTWEACEAQIKGIKDAKFKSFGSITEANKAFLLSPEKFIGKKTRDKTAIMCNYKTLPAHEQPFLDSIAVDAACSGNPGKMEYRGVDVKTGDEIFHYGPLAEGTNNIGEFLGIVHAAALFFQTNPTIPIYSDSMTAISWIRNKKAKTLLKPNDKNKVIFELIQRAENWLAKNTIHNPVLKWNTKKWGEIPADFGRK